MNQHTHKIDAANFHYANKFYKQVYKALIASTCLFFQGCFLTQTQALRLQTKIEKVEDEVAKMQSIKHDLDIFMNEQVKTLIEKINYLDAQVAMFKTTLEDNLKEKEELVTELKKLTQEIELNKQAYDNLLQNNLKHKITVKNASDVLQESQKLAKEQKFTESINILENFIKEFPQDEKIHELNHQLAKILKDFYDNELNQEKKSLAQKKAVIIYKNLLQDSNLAKDDLLYSLGFLLKDMNNYQAAISIFKQLAELKNTQKAKEALKQIAELEKKK